MAEINLDKLKEKIVHRLQTIYDPEIPVNIYDLGLVYEVAVDDEGHVDVEMTLTSPMCPVAESLPIEVENQIKDIKEVTACTVEVVWDPPWNYNMMSEDARLELNMM